MSKPVDGSTFAYSGGRRGFPSAATKERPACGTLFKPLMACRFWLLAALILTGSVAMADSCPYCGQYYGEPMPGDEARVYALRRAHEASCPSRPQGGGGGGNYGGGGNIFDELFRRLRQPPAQPRTEQPRRSGSGSLFKPSAPPDKAASKELSEAANRFEQMTKSAPPQSSTKGGTAAAAPKTGLFNRLFGRKANPDDPGLQARDRIPAGSDTSARRQGASAQLHGEQAVKAKSPEEMKAKAGLGFDTSGRTPAGADSGRFLRAAMTGPSRNILYRKELPKEVKLPPDVEQRRRALVNERVKQMENYRNTYLNYAKAKDDPVKRDKLEKDLTRINRSVHETETKIEKELSNAAQKDPQLQDSLIKVLLVEE